MKLAHYERNGAVRVGLVDKTRIMDLAEFAKEVKMPAFVGITSIDEILSQGLLEPLQKAAAKIADAKGGVPIDSARLRSPILNPEKILLVARNYLSHNEEQNAQPPSEPYFFTKFRNTLIGPSDPILIPKISKKADWEAELAVVIGKTGKNILRKDAIDHVAGYAVSDDISFRDLQFSTRPDKAPVTLGHNWLKGKGLDSSFPLGPWLVKKDEISNPHDLEISLRVNGEIKQHSKTSDMIFTIDRLIEYVSGHDVEAW